MHRKTALRASVVVAFLFATLPAAAETMDLHLTFEAHHQSMWGAGGAGAPAPTTFYIINPNTVHWDFKAPGDYPNYAGSFFDQDTYLFGTAHFGAGGKAASSGKIGLSTTFFLDNPGSVDVSYPVHPQIVFPDANSFRAGDTVTIQTSNVPDAGFALTTVSPQFHLTLDYQFKLFAQADAKFCIFACLDTDDLFPSNLKPDINLGDDASHTLLTIATDCASRPAPCFNGAATPAWFGLVTGSPIDFNMHVPNISTTGVRDSDSRSLVATGNDAFVNGSLDVAGILAEAAHVPIPLEFSTDSVPVDLHGFSFHYTILHGALTGSLNANQSFHFDPTLKIGFKFGMPLEHWIGSSGAHVTSDTAELTAGETLFVKYPSDVKQPTPITPTFSLPNRFDSHTYMTAGVGFELAALAIGGHTPEIEVFPRLCTPAFCTPEVSVAGVTIIPEVCVPEICTPAVNVPPVDIGNIGPVYSNTWPIISNAPLGDLFNDHWSIPLDPQTKSAFQLDPENPIIALNKQVTSTVNLGAGKRRVNYVIDVSNPGDVKLNSLHLTDNLATTFAGARSFSVDQILGCSLTPSSGYDGKTSFNLITGDDSIEPGASKRFFVIVTVAPQPDPPPYVNTASTDGTSRLGTLVSKTATASVTLGPAPIRTLDDLVLFGDHFLKLEAIGDSFGSMASNEFLEVKAGTSGTVAGDLRSNREIRVQGTILADYAISSGQVNVIGKGALSLTGNMKEFAPVAGMLLPAVQFAPTSALLGNVFVADNTTQTVGPGYYGSVTVGNGASLTLSQGVYFIGSLLVGTNGRMTFTGPVTLTTGDSLQFGDGSVLAGGGPTRGIHINAAEPGAVLIGTGAQLRGTLTAPRANIIFGNNSKLNGAAYGSTVTLQPGASVSYHRDCDPILDPNCDGTPDCP